MSHKESMSKNIASCNFIFPMVTSKFKYLSFARNFRGVCYYLVCTCSSSTLLVQTFKDRTLRKYREMYVKFHSINDEFNLYTSSHQPYFSMYWKLKYADSTVKRFMDHQTYYCRWAQCALSSDLRIVVDTDGPIGHNSPCMNGMRIFLVLYFLICSLKVITKNLKIYSYCQLEQTD